MSTINERNKVFVSYSHEDREWLELMRPHFKPLERDYGIDFWDDTKIKLGVRWREEIESALNTAKVAICLVSADFLASDFIKNDELPSLLEAAKRKGAKVIPIIVRPCMFEETNLSQFQAGNEPSKPLSALSRNEQENLFLKISREIVEEFRKAKKHTLFVSDGQKPTRRKPATPQDSAPKPLRQELTDEQIDLISNLREEFRDAERRKFTFLLIGRMGVGKSSTINSLLGKKVAKVGRLKKVTNKISRHEGEIEGIRYSIVDTPGLADPDSEKDRIYLSEIKRTIKRIDCMWFVSPLHERRVEYDTNIIKLVCEIFGKEIWKRAIFVFTFADMVKSEKLLERLDERTILLRDEIKPYAGIRIARSIPAVAVCNDEDGQFPVPLPNGELWLGELYMKVLSRISKEGAKPFIFATRNRITDTKPPRSVQTKSSKIYISPDNGFWPMVGKILGTGISIGLKYYISRGPNGAREDIAKLKEILSRITKKG
jgi:small GTP-binding protein